MGENRLMSAVVIKDFGAPSNLEIGEVPIPSLQPNEVLVKVAASALNRADTLQRKGLYPPPPGASKLLGLEMAGTIVEVGDEVTTWEVGDKVMGLLSGGGYAQFAAIHEDLAMPVPDDMDLYRAAAIPEVFLTAFQAIVLLAKFQANESILIHAGASGVGTAAIQLAKELGADRIYVTASKSKHDICSALGAHLAIDYKSESFEEVIHQQTRNKGVDVIIDFLGASYFSKNIASLGMDGRMILLALMGGVHPDSVHLGHVLRKRLHIIGSTLRARSIEYKIELTRRFAAYALPKFSSGALQPVIDSYFDWKDVAQAHEYMEANKNKGKIVLKIS